MDSEKGWRDMKKRILIILAALVVILCILSVPLLLYLNTPFQFRFVMESMYPTPGRRGKTFFDEWKDEFSEYSAYKLPDYDHDRYDTICFEVKQNRVLYIMYGLELPNKTLNDQIYMFPVRVLYIIHLTEYQSTALAEFAKETSMDSDVLIRDFYSEKYRWCYLQYDGKTIECGVDYSYGNLMHRAQDPDYTLSPLEELMYALYETQANHRPVFQ